jgi:hypothetical protein
MGNIHVQQALDILGGGLDEFITARMTPLTGPLAWTTVLSELDHMRGKDGWTYSRTDVALQLRMLTERLGNLGYPFDAGDPNRTLSSYGSVLRIVRKRWAHNDAFGTFDALTAVDTVRTVLAHIGDGPRAAQAAQLRTCLLSGLVDTADERPGPESPAEVQAPSEPADAQTIPGERVKLDGAVPWEPWTVAVIGEQADLDSLRPRRVKEMVRSLIEDIAEAEGPVHRDRLTKLVGYGFGFARLSAVRAKRITHQIPQASVFIDEHGFVWPEGIDTSRWLIHRTSVEVQRPFEEISPVEIANAAASLLKDDGTLSTADLRQKILGQFGRRKKSKGADQQVDLGIACAVSSGRLSHHSRAA